MDAFAETVVSILQFDIVDGDWSGSASSAAFDQACLATVQVYQNGKGYDIDIDCHRGGACQLQNATLCLHACYLQRALPNSPRVCALVAGVNNNLFTNINIGLGTRPFNSGGNTDRGANSGEPAVGA